MTNPASNSAAGTPGAPIKRNRILIARTRNQANRWKKVLQPADRAAIHDNYFPQEAVLGVFFHRDQTQAVKVTGLWVNGTTLEVALELVPWPIYLCIPPPATAECPVFTIPAPASQRFAYALVAVGQAALTRVHRLVVIQEVDDAPEVVNLGTFVPI